MTTLPQKRVLWKLAQKDIKPVMKRVIMRFMCLCARLIRMVDCAYTFPVAAFERLTMGYDPLV